MSYYPSDAVYLTQGEPLSLTNTLYRTRVARLLADADNQVAAVIQRQPLKVVTAIEQRVIDGYTTTYTLTANQVSILARLRIPYGNPDEMSPLVTVLAALIPPFLPYSIDFSTLSDGALPATFSGASWTIASGKAVNTPTAGAELLTNPTLAGTYVSGLAPSMTKGGTPTVAESADGHGDTQAQEFTAGAIAQNVQFPVIAAVNGAWYRFSGWVKRTAGTGVGTRIRCDQGAAMPAAALNAGVAINVAAYAQKQTSFATRSTGNITPFAVVEQDASAFDTVIVDDFSLKRLTEADLPAWIQPTQADVIVKAIPNTLADGTVSAVIARSDAGSGYPTTALFAFWRWRDPEDFINVSLWQLSGGVWSVKVAENVLTIVANAWVEIRVNGTTAKLYYNNAQLGTDQTVTPTGVNHGMFMTGGNTIKQFFVQAN